MTETRKLAAILVADVVGYSRLAGADEDRTLARLRGLRSDLIDPADRRASRPHRQAHRRRQPHRVPQRGRRGALRDRGADWPGRAQRRPAAGTPHRVPRRHSSRRRRRGERRRPDGRRRQYRGAARRRREPGAICLSEHAYRQVKGRLDRGIHRSRRERSSRTSPSRSGSMRSYGGDSAPLRSRGRCPAKIRARRASPSSSCRSPISAAIPSRSYFVDGVTESLTTDLSRIGGAFVIAPQHGFHLQGQAVDVRRIGAGAERSLCPGGQRSARAETGCASMSSSSTPRAAIISGPSGSISPWPTSSTCRTKSSRALRTRSTRSSRRGEARRAERAPNPDLMDLNFRGWALWNKGVTPDGLAEARRLFERALALDPANVEGWSASPHVELKVALVSSPRIEPRGLPPLRRLRSRRCPWLPRMPAPICAWAWSKSGPSAPPREFGHASGRWNSTETLLKRTDK